MADLVALVVVSHSRPLARAAVELALQMAQDAPVRVAVAAGVDDAGSDGPGLGTDAVAIADAIGEVAGAAGVVVLMDLGSAVLSAELALELLDPDVRERVVLSPAPLVEGLVGAVVAAAGGAGRDEVAAEAVAGLAPKAGHLDPPPSREGFGPPSGSPGEGGAGSPPAASASAPEGGSEPPAGLRASFVVNDPQGLHARPAAALIGAVRGVEAAVTLRNLTTGAGPVPAESLSRVATLEALAGHEVEIGVPAGEDAALRRVLAAAHEIFGPPPAPRWSPPGSSTRPPAGPPPSASPAGPPSTASAAGEPAPTAAPFASVSPGSASAGLAGSAWPGTAPAVPLAPAVGAGPLAASPGIVVGVVRQRPRGGPGTASAIAPVDGGGPESEQQRLEAALAAVARDLASVRERVAAELGDAEAGIFDAHALLLDDPELRTAASARIASGADAGAAWAAAIGAAETAWSALADPYLRARAADLVALRDQVLAVLATPPGPDAPAMADSDAADLASGDVLVASDLTPVEAVALDPARIGGVVLAHGSPTAHSVLLLRARAIPAVVAAGDAVLAVPDGTTVALDGSTGELVLDPAPTVRERFARTRADAARHASAAAAGAARP
ncbi:dihydroxyacetone kinase phosphoryl donor subunit DhaM, partial [Cryptosporangium minutisporangium]|uniref:dihydroxyacetone kinase phosphoryl donor subunit DhaM n=1 Tax=Cryptosporangium minutisporangium TaxID=113569 RepID=UPI0031F09199